MQKCERKKEKRERGKTGQKRLGREQSEGGKSKNSRDSEISGVEQRKGGGREATEGRGQEPD